MILSNKTLLEPKGFIDGKWIHAHDGRTMDVTNPATGKVITIVPKMSATDVDFAINAAEQAFATYKKTTAKERYSLLHRWYELMLENQEDLATILTSEQGKPFAEAKGEVLYAANFLQWFAEEAKRIEGDILPSHLPNSQILVSKMPIGVVAAITPWNFPLAMVTRKLGPALAAGCTCVLKPASQTPLSAIALCKLAEQAGIPAGVINLVLGSAGEIGDVLTTDDRIKKISFTGSTKVGKSIMKNAAGTIKKLSLELGGNAPFIVFDDANIDQAVDAFIATKYRNTGQTCVCANRLLVQTNIADAFLEKLTAKVKTFKIGGGFEEGVVQGPLINEAAVKKMEQHIDDALRRGATLLCGGKRSDKGGTFFEPTVLKNVPKDALVAKEETFGPLAPAFTFESEEEAITFANDTSFGLSAYFCARDVGRIFRVMEGLEYGIIGINEGIISTETAPFGGVKESGLGREGSKYGIEEYLELKYALLKY